MATEYAGRTAATWYEIWEAHRSKWLDHSRPESRRCNSGCGAWPCKERSEAEKRLAQADVNPRAVMRGEEQLPA